MSAVVGNGDRETELGTAAVQGVVIAHEGTANWRECDGCCRERPLACPVAPGGSPELGTLETVPPIDEGWGLGGGAIRQLKGSVALLFRTSAVNC